MIYKEKANLIIEAEEMIFNRDRNSDTFPKYIIIREIESWMKKTNICSYKTLKIVKEGVVGIKNKNEKLMVIWVKIEFF